ncbi:MAG: hypothetical protein ACOYEK_06555 [bacterium]|jgi:hypothetical protein
MLFVIFFIILFLTSVAAWINTKIILEDLAEIKAALALKREGQEGDAEGK